MKRWPCHAVASGATANISPRERVREIPGPLSSTIDGAPLAGGASIEAGVGPPPGVGRRGRPSPALPLLPAGTTHPPEVVVGISAQHHLSCLLSAATFDRDPDPTIPRYGAGDASVVTPEKIPQEIRYILNP